MQTETRRIHVVTWYNDHRQGVDEGGSGGVSAKNAKNKNKHETLHAYGGGGAKQNSGICYENKLA